jgi:uncharacterized SAM-binding protein YcdF (DUF218 family)
MIAATTEPASSVIKSRSCRAAWRRGLLVLVAIGAVLGVAAWVEREALLRSAADIWIVSDQPAPADAVAVFGGGVETRPFAAARYYKDGLVKKILLSDSRVGAAAQLGAVMSDAADREVLLKLGVPKSDIETFGSGLANTHQEALALRDWADRMHVRSIIVPTEIFSTRRVRWMLHHAFGDGFAILVPALDPPNYRRDDWWRHSEGIITFQNEVLKYLYYRLKY